MKRFIKRDVQHFCIALALLLTASEGSISNNLVEDVVYPKCDLLLKQIAYREITAPVPLEASHLQGRWISQSCETRPGNLHTIRSYTINHNGKMELVLHTYYDEFCSIPKVSVVAQGQLTLMRDSMRTPGGTEADYYIESMSLVVHSLKAYAEVLKELNATSCATSVVDRIKPHRLSLLLDPPASSNDVDVSSLKCIPSLVKTWNEFQLLRVEIERHESVWKNTSCKVKELFLGDLHSNPRWQDHYKPTSYQTPLVNTDCILNCKECKIIAKATPEKPPLFRRVPKKRLQKMMDGSWASLKCEVQRHGLFLTRKITFRSSRPRWNIKQRYFSDPFCRKPSYTIFASGTYKRPTNTSGYDEDKAMNMIVRKMSITPDDKNFATQLNRISGRRCGIAGKWRRGKVQDVTVTGGCTSIGLKVPSKEPEILRMDYHENGQISLFLGLTPTWSYRGAGSAPRPTAWGPPLQRCSPLPIDGNHLPPIVGARVALAQATALSGHLAHLIFFHVLLMLLNAN